MLGSSTVNLGASGRSVVVGGWGMGLGGLSWWEVFFEDSADAGDGGSDVLYARGAQLVVSLFEPGIGVGGFAVGDLQQGVGDRFGVVEEVC